MLLGVRGRARLQAAMALGVCLVAGRARAEGTMWHALPVAGGTDALAGAARLEPGLPAWRVFYECARRRHGLWGEEAGGAAPSPVPMPARGVVPLPLAPDAWRWIMGRGGLDDQLAAAILEDRRASLLYRGLAAFDEPTLAALASDLPALRRIYRQHAEALAAFGARFEVDGGAVQLPGGREAAGLWEDLVGESPLAPARFLENLLAAKGGRRAFLFDSLARLDPVHQRFALSAGPSPGPVSAAAFWALVAVFDREPSWWRRTGRAFARPDADAARLLREVRLGTGGSLAAPSARAFWRAAFQGSAPEARDAWLAEVRASTPADGAWLAAQVGTGDAATRRLRFEQVSLAQRVFGEAGADALPDVLAALHALRDARTAVLTLERMGSRDPSLYAAAGAAARYADSVSGRERRLRTQAALQGALGLIGRARFAGTIDVAEAESLAGTLFALTRGDESAFDRAVARWVEATLLPALARGVYGALPPGDADTTVLRAMAGDRLERREDTAFEWEGLSYRVDPGRAEFGRLERVRARQGGASLAPALESCRAVAVGGGDRPCGIGALLASLVYAAHLGDPDGPALAGEDASRRHEFGPEPWGLPEEVAGPGVPWHVSGSLLGLEWALGRLSLHRLAGDELPETPPVVGAVRQRWLALTAALANPRDLADADRDALLAALAAGRRRAASLEAGAADLEAASRDAGLEPWRARALPWMLEHEASARDTFFSLGELLRLGAPGEDRWGAWGAPDELTRGLILRMPGARPLDESAGRLPEPALAEAFVDLPLRVAEHLGERRLPASLGPAVVATLLPDLCAEARPVAIDDRLGLDAWVRALPRERLDDAVASLAGRGPLQPAPRSGGIR